MLCKCTNPYAMLLTNDTNWMGIAWSFGDLGVDKYNEERCSSGATSDTSQACEWCYIAKSNYIHYLLLLLHVTYIH